MTDIEKLKAELEAAIDVAYARYNAALDAASAAYRAAYTGAFTAYHGACDAYNVALAAQEKEQDA